MSEITKRCKHCERMVTGQPVFCASPTSGMSQSSVPLYYRFICGGAGPHGDNDKDREWIVSEPDPRD